MYRRFGALAVLIAAAACGASIALRGHAAIPDDVYFYLKIAGAIVDGAGSTFDGLRPTNGYHPLWLVCCVALRGALGGLTPHAMLSAHLVMSALGSVLAVWLLLRLRSFDTASSGAPVAAVVVAAYVSTNAYGSELHASLPLLVLAFHLACMRLGPAYVPSVRGDVAFGAVLGFACLARLDNVFLVAALGASAVLATRAPRGARAWGNALRCAAVAGAVLAPYLAWNLHEFGHVVPISGAVKAGLAAKAGIDLRRVGSQAWVLIVITWLAIPYYARRAAISPFDRTMALAATGAGLHALYVVLRMDQIWTWYFAGELVVSALCVQGWLQQLPQARRTTWLVLVFSLVRMAWVDVKAHASLAAAPEAWYLETARWLDTHLPSGAPVAVTCSPGSVAYFSRHPIVALDGLTGDFTFHERARAVGLSEALSELGVGHVMTMGPISRELSHYAAITRRLGHGGEGPSFFGEPVPPDATRATQVGLWSAIVRADVGTIELAPSNLVGTVASYRELGVWRLPGPTAHQTGP